MRERSLLIYGATGYSGRLLVQQAIARGLTPVIAGRDAAKVETLARAHGLAWHAVALPESDRLRALTASATVVLNAAGPFARTARPLVDACLASGAHYLDITGEVQVVEAIAARHDEAVARGVMLMPAVGFDVVPSDCLAAHVMRELPDATTLRIGVDVPTALSRGSMQTGLAQAADGIWAREDGRLVAHPPGSRVHRFDFDGGSQLALAVSLCDVTTAFHSTGVPNIATYFRASLPLWTTLGAMRAWGPALASAPWSAALGPPSSWLPEGPTEAQRRAGSATVVVEAIDARGRRACSRLRTPEAYAVTADAAIRVAARVLGGDVNPGFETPARLFGPDFALTLDGVCRVDL